MKQIRFVGDSLERIKDFPFNVRKEAGVQLHLVQQGFDPADWKPMKGIDTGVREIRIRDEAGAFRIIYVASIQDAIYVLHAFQKKTQRTANRDLELAGERLKRVIASLTGN